MIFSFLKQKNKLELIGSVEVLSWKYKIFHSLEGCFENQLCCVDECVYMHLVGNIASKIFFMKLYIKSGRAKF